MSSQIICPFCFEAFDRLSVLFRCANPRCPKVEEDPVYAEARGLRTSRPMGHVFGRKILSTKEKILHQLLDAKCDACGKDSSKRLCPRCHFELSHDAGMIDDHIIAI